MSSTILPDHYLLEIGRLTANFAILESTLNRAIQFLLDLEEREGKILTAEMSFRNKMHLIGSLYRDKISDTNLLNDLNVVMKSIGQIEERRNQITHSTWGYDPKTNTYARIKRTAKQDKGLKEQDEEINPFILQSIAHEIDMAERRFTDFMKASFP